MKVMPLQQFFGIKGSCSVKKYHGLLIKKGLRVTGYLSFNHDPGQKYENREDSYQEELQINSELAVMEVL